MKFYYCSCNSNPTSTPVVIFGPFRTVVIEQSEEGTAHDCQVFGHNICFCPAASMKPRKHLRSEMVFLDSFVFEGGHLKNSNSNLQRPTQWRTPLSP